MQAVPDIELLERCTAGDKDAFAVVVQRYQNMVCSIAYSVLGDFSRSEDIGQETMVAAWKQLPQLQDLSKFPSWIAAIARNRAVSFLRRERSTAQLVDDVATDDVSTDSVISQEEETLAWKTLQSLPENYREPLVLFYRQDRSVVEIASALELTEATVRQRLHRGRELLRTEVAAVVERTLRNSVPGTAFTAAVMGSVIGLGSATASAAVAGTAGKVSAPLVVAATKTGLAAGVLGIAIGVAGAILGPWMAWKNARYESERALYKDTARQMFVVILLVTIPMALLADQWRQWNISPIGFATTLSVMTVLQLILLLAIGLRGQRAWKRLLSKEILANAHTLPVNRTQRWLSRWKGRNYTSQATLLGLPLVQIAMPDLFDHWQMKATGESHRTAARAWIAIGDKAYGVVLAMGGIAVGGIAFGGLSIGVIAFGGVGLGLGLVTIAGLGIGALSMAGCALGAFSYGGLAIGWLAFGGAAVAWKCAVGGAAVAREFAIGGAAVAPQANTQLAKQFAESHTFFRTAEHMAASPMMGLLFSVGWIIPLLTMWLLAYRYESPMQASITETRSG